jgi:hypothetical protein
MQTAPRFWTRDARRRTPRPVRHRVRPGMLGEPMTRCHRCDIPLGSYPCPNPLCPEQHGQSAGMRCAWCLHNDAARSDLMDLQAYDGHTEAANHGVYHTSSGTAF